MFLENIFVWKVLIEVLMFGKIYNLLFYWLNLLRIRSEVLIIIWILIIYYESKNGFNRGVNLIGFFF